MAWAVRFEDVSKQYRGSRTGYPSLRGDLAHLGRRALSLFRREPARSGGFLALDHVSFEVEEGESFAIIGPNGSGKTTSLKLLTRISYPTGGCIRSRGRVGALIEVGSGIHPELTGRENIWLYGRIMGMSRQEIARRFDEIVDFSELEHVLDVPTKMYSSGMQLRLGFAIASHIDPDIFIVDEALAVGDAGFQSKCVERMTQLVHEGRTLLFVSHNLPSVESLCKRALFLCDGRVATLGNTPDVLRTYLDWTERHILARRRAKSRESDTSAPVEIVGASCHDATGQERYEFTADEPVEIRVHFLARKPIRGPNIDIGISDGRPGLLINCTTARNGDTPREVAGAWTTACRIAKLNLLPRMYHVWCDVSSEKYGEGMLCPYQQVAAFKVVGERAPTGRRRVTMDVLEGAVRADYQMVHSVDDDVTRAPAGPEGPSRD